jgi:DNA polymerase III delta subunit
MARPLSYAELSRQFESSGSAGAYFLCGPETYLRDTAILRLQTLLFGDADKARLGRDRFYGGEGPLTQVTSALASVGLFTGTRLVTLSDAERCGRAGAAERRELIERLRTASPGSVFVAFSELPVRELERKNDFTRALLQTCTVAEMNHPTPAEALRWLLDDSVRRGIPMDAEAATLLVSRIGPSLQDLAREMEKLELWMTVGERVTVGRIEEMVRHGQLGTGWEFCEAVLSGQTARALALWSPMQRAEPVLRTQWLLQRQARDRLARGSGGRESGAFLSDLLLRAYELERGIKSGRIPSGRDGTALELLVASSGGGRTRPATRIRTPNQI